VRPAGDRLDVTAYGHVNFARRRRSEILFDIGGIQGINGLDRCFEARLAGAGTPGSWMPLRLHQTPGVGDGVLGSGDEGAADAQPLTGPGNRIELRYAGRPFGTVPVYAPSAAKACPGTRRLSANQGWLTGYRPQRAYTSLRRRGSTKTTQSHRSAVAFSGGMRTSFPGRLRTGDHASFGLEFVKRGGQLGGVPASYYQFAAIERLVPRHC
jgi:hypothetical protein